jgi:hypothetical protein
MIGLVVEALGLVLRVLLHLLVLALIALALLLRAESEPVVRPMGYARDAPLADVRLHQPMSVPARGAPCSERDWACAGAESVGTLSR